MRKGSFAVAVLGFSAVLLSGCGDDSSQSESSASSTEPSKSVVESTTEKASNAMKEAGDSMQSAADAVVDKTKEMASETKEMAVSAADSVAETSSEMAAAAADTVTEAATSVENAVSGGQSGEAVYSGLCMSCHTSGILQAPVTGDKAAWATRLEKGRTTLYDSAINGIGAMPAKGGNPALSDAEVKAAVDYMLSQSE